MVSLYGLHGRKPIFIFSDDPEKKTVRKMPLAKYNDESKPLFLTLDHTDYREGQIMKNFLNEIQRWGGETNLE